MQLNCTLNSIAIFIVACFALCNTMPSKAVEPPLPYGPVPSARQLKWHDLEFYGFVHFTTNTFTDKEWGYGDESPEVFSPTDFDADSIVRVAKQAGMRGLILTCKHHDGFCLWPSDYTDHSVEQSPWKNGQGDVVREVAEACKRNELAFGIYLSPWDRNHPDYGNPSYVEYYRNQLEELLTNYGPVFEVWLDGANGGDGYYGGARETRRIDRSQYYDWQTTFDLIRRLQPEAVIFSDAGPDVRWIGNERGIAGEPCWATYTPQPAEGEQSAGPGATRFKEALNGHRDGDFWMPAEADVSIRPGWFYHVNQDAQVRTPENLVDLYFTSVGRGASLLLNLPPDQRGQIHERDQAALQEFRRRLDALFADNLARQGQLEASNERGDAAQFAARQVLDGDQRTYWTTDDAQTNAHLTFSYAEAVRFDVVDMREFLPLGQRVHAWALDFWKDGAWSQFASGESI